MGTGSPYDRRREKAGSRRPAFSALPGFDFELDLIARGHRLIAGVDEAGRGALAGPLSVGMVIFSLEVIRGDLLALRGITDSKKLTPARRAAALVSIERMAMVSAEHFVSHRTIDRYNVNRATEIAICRLLERSPCKPDVILLDGTFSFDVGVPIIAVKGGDGRSLSIAAASIVAKVRRDHLMVRLDARYPGYHLEKNKGYGTAAHLEAIARLGGSAIHRKSYDPIRSILETAEDDGGFS